MNSQTEVSAESDSQIDGYRLINENPSPTVTTTLVRDGREEKVSHLKPEDAGDYLLELTMGADSDYRAPVDMPDPEEFSEQNVRVEAQAGETLQYEIEVEGHEGSGSGYLLKDGDGNEYVSTEDGETYRLDETQIIFSAETRTADEQTRNDFTDVVRELEE